LKFNPPSIPQNAVHKQHRRKIGKRKKGGKVSNPEIKTGSGFPSKKERECFITFMIIQPRYGFPLNDHQ